MGWYLQNELNIFTSKPFHVLVQKQFNLFFSNGRQQIMISIISLILGNLSTVVTFHLKKWLGALFKSIHSYLQIKKLLIDYLPLPRYKLRNHSYVILLARSQCLKLGNHFPTQQIIWTSLHIMSTSGLISWAAVVTR